MCGARGRRLTRKFGWNRKSAAGCERESAESTSLYCAADFFSFFFFFFFTEFAARPYGIKCFACIERRGGSDVFGFRIEGN